MNSKKGRDIDGLLVLDKPRGLSSNQCLQRVRKLLGAARAGHTGSLDPLATGVLPLCFGEATKVSQYLLDSDKSYRARIRLGIRTSTADSEGEVLEQAPVPALEEAEIRRVLAGMTGASMQQAPAYSALKQDGVPLYKLARQGLEIRPKVRHIVLHRLELLDWNSPELEIEVDCSKGTYVRTLAENIGARLGTLAHLCALRRLRASPFELSAALTLQQAEQLAAEGSLEAKLLPMDSALESLASVMLDPAQALRLRQGQKLLLAEQAPAGLVRVYSGGAFIGIGTVDAEGILTACRLLKY